MVHVKNYETKFVTVMERKLGTFFRTRCSRDI